MHAGVVQCTNFTAHLGRWAVPVTRDDAEVCRSAALMAASELVETLQLLEIMQAMHGSIGCACIPSACIQLCIF